MSNYIYGSATMGCLVILVNIINSHLPNSLWYYIDSSLMPF